MEGNSKIWEKNVPFFRFELTHSDLDRVSRKKHVPFGSIGFCAIHFPTGQEDKYKKVLIDYIKKQIEEQMNMDKRLLDSLTE